MASLKMEASNFKNLFDFDWQFWWLIKYQWSAICIMTWQFYFDELSWWAVLVLCLWIKWKLFLKCSESVLTQLFSLHNSICYSKETKKLFCFLKCQLWFRYKFVEKSCKYYQLIWLFVSSEVKKLIRKLLLLHRV